MAIIEAGVGAWLVGMAGVYGKYLWDQRKGYDRLLRERLETVMRRNKFGFLNADGSIDRPYFISLERESTGYLFQYRLPLGLTIDHVQRIRKALEGATDSEIDAWTEGQTLYLRLYTGRIPEHAYYSTRFAQAARKRNGLAIAVGYGRRGIEVLDFDSMPAPHILIGGGTGYGKSNLIHVIVTQLLQRGDCKLYLIDPKRVELVTYEGLRHVRAVAKDVESAHAVLQHVVKEFARRLQAWEQVGARNLQQYNQKTGRNEPYLFVIADELVDFEKDEKFWPPLIALAAKGRAFGINLIFSTQRPDASIFPPQVKANIGYRIGFKTFNEANSKIIFGEGYPEAAYLPPRKGRALIMVNDGLREVQVPHLTPKRQAAILRHLRGGDNDRLDLETLRDRSGEQSRPTLEEVLRRGQVKGKKAKRKAAQAG